MSAEVDELRRSLTEVRQRLLETIAGVSEEQFKKRPPAPAGATGPNWCIAEVLAHLLQQERLRASRISLALQQDGIVITPGTDEEHYEAARSGRASPVPQLIHGLLASRREVESLLDEASGIEGGLERKTTHPVLGAQSIAWILRTKVIDHEAEHVAQIETIKAALATT
ncbi:MAG TPA: DinB family protein [Dehalococcoidia bacterium]|nr:DinB family protein [Dehalococcoidia bacterium]